MATMQEQTQEYGSSEAGQALAKHGFRPVAVGGVVVLRGERNGVTLDVQGADVDTAPRELSDAIRVNVFTARATGSWVVPFPSVTAFIATL